MASPQKRIFAGKANLQPEPFCPYITNESGYLSQRQHLNRQQRKASRRSSFSLFSSGGRSRII